MAKQVRKVPLGTNFYVGPLRVYVANNINGKCDTFVSFGKHGLGHHSHVDEDVLLDLMREADGYSMPNKKRDRRSLTERLEEALEGEGSLTGSIML